MSVKVNLNVIGLPSEIHVHESFTFLSSASSIALWMPVSDGWSEFHFGPYSSISTLRWWIDGKLDTNVHSPIKESQH